MPAPRLAAALALSTLLFHGVGCESCEFSFGPVVLAVPVNPVNRPVTVTVCAEEQICETVVLPADDGTPPDPDLPPMEDEPQPGEPATFFLQWHGYGACKIPEMTVTVSAEGCETVEIHRDRRRPSRSEDDRILAFVEVPVTLECP